MPRSFLTFFLLAGVILPTLSFVTLGWNCATFFEGLWHVEKFVEAREVSPADLEALEGALPTQRQNVTFNITKSAYEGVLLGLYVALEKSSPIIASSEVYHLKITHSSAMKGSFAIQRPDSETQEEEEAEHPRSTVDEEEEEDFYSSHRDTILLLDFEFTRSYGAAMMLAQGRYRNPSKGGLKTTIGSYQFVVPKDDQFVLVLTSDSNKESTVYMGRKQVKKVEPSFLQKFGPTVLIVVIFVGMKMFTSTLKNKSTPPTSHIPEGKKKL